MTRSYNFAQRMAALIRRESNTLIFGLGTTCDAIFIAKGGLEHNAYFSYAALAGTVGNMVMLLPRVVEGRRGKDAAETFARHLKKFAGPLHNSAGIGMILSGFDFGHTGISLAEMLLGLCSTLGSLSQFWGDEILQATRWNKTCLFKFLHGGRLALIFYSPSTIFVFADAWRLRSPILLIAGLAASCVITLLWNRELHQIRKQDAAEDTALGTLSI